MAGSGNTQEPEEMREQKRLSWLRAHEQQQGVPCLESGILDTESDMDLEDEVQEVSTALNPEQCVLVQVHGRRTEAYDPNLDFNETL